MVLLAVIGAHDTSPLRFGAVDAYPGRAAGLANTVARSGIPSIGIEGKVENILPTENPLIRGVYVSVIDDMTATSLALTTLLERPVGVLGYLFIRDPQGRLFSISLAIPAGESADLSRAILFTRSLGYLRARGGYEEVFGPEAAGAAALTVEPVLRDGFSRHARRNLTPLLAGLELQSHPMELSIDLRPPMPLIVVDSRVRWEQPNTLAQRVVQAAPVVFERRAGWFAVGEIGPDSNIRLHTAQLRASDDIDVTDTTLLDATEALQGAERRQWSRQRGIHITD
jgi:hypothetical protein